MNTGKAKMKLNEEELDEVVVEVVRRVRPLLDQWFENFLREMRDAVQKLQAGEVPSQEQAKDGEEVGEGGGQQVQKESLQA